MKQKQLVIFTFWMLLITTGCRGNHLILKPLERGISSRLQTLEAKAKVQATQFPLETESDLQMSLEQHIRTENLSEAMLAVASASSQQRWIGAASQPDAAKSANVMPTSRFAIGNLNEMVIAVVCLQLVSEETLNLKKPIARWLPDELIQRLPEAKEVTLRQLLNHTSALPNLDQEALKSAVAADPNRRWTTAELLNFTAEQRPTRPRGLYTYSAANYLLLELIIERATKHSFAEEIQTRIIQPLQLKNTSVGLPETPDKTPDKATNQPLLKDDLDRRKNVIISDAPDLIRFMQALFLDNTLLNAAEQAEMLTTVETRRGSYGLGIVNTMTRWGEVWGQVNSTTDPTATVVYIPVHDLILVSWASSNEREHPRPMEMIDDGLTVVLGNSNRFNGATVQW